MTQLDRLEALATNSVAEQMQLARTKDIWLVLDALPDLIRVARAAKAAADDDEFQVMLSIARSEADIDNAASIQELLDLMAKSPLFSEVDS